MTTLTTYESQVVVEGTEYNNDVLVIGMWEGDAKIMCRIWNGCNLLKNDSGEMATVAVYAKQDFAPKIECTEEVLQTYADVAWEDGNSGLIPGGREQVNIEDAGPPMKTGDTRTFFLRDGCSLGW